MADDPALQLGDDVQPTERVLPVFLHEPFLGIVPERNLEQRSDRGDLDRAELTGLSPP